VTLAGAVLFLGCAATPEAPRAEQVTRTGYLARDVLQHPVQFDPETGRREDQFYFDLGAAPKSMRQIIVVNRSGTPPPKESGRKIELTGVVERIECRAKGPPDSRYENEVLYLRSWRYVDPEK